MVGLGRFELPTSPLSGVRSNQLSYRPANRSLRCQLPLARCPWRQKSSCFSKRFRGHS